MPDRGDSWLVWALTVGATLMVMALVTVRVASSVDARGDDGRFTFEALQAAGLKVDARVDDGEVGRLVTAGLVHTSTTHLVINGLGLLLTSLFWWRASPPHARGWAQAWLLPAILIVTSSAGFLLSWLLRAGPSGGASAGVYGLLAAVAGATWTQRAVLPVRLRWTAPLALTLLSLAMVLVLLGRAGMDHAAHIGGWAVGLPTGAAVRFRAGRMLLAVIATGLIALAIAL